MNMIHINSLDIKEPLLLKFGETYTLVVDQHNSSSIYILEFQDKLFRTNSAVVLPEMEKPADSTDGSKISPIAMIASCLQYAFNTSKAMLVTGHTDTAGNTEYNVKLSQKRAQTVLATLIGDSDAFADICSQVEYRRNSDYNQILAWVSEKWNWDCHPGQINDNRNDLIVNKFRKEYNSKGPGSSWAPKITEWGGAGGKEIWTAYFNCYESFLLNELKTDRDGLKKLRENCTFVIQRKWVGCSEYHPRAAQNIDEFPCDTNRRVEIAFFDKGEKPSLMCESDPALCAKNDCVFYDPKKYPREILPPVISPVVTGVSWANATSPAQNGTFKKVIFQGGGIPDSTPVVFSFYFEFNGKKYNMPETLTAAMYSGKAEMLYNRWFSSSVKITKVNLGEAESFPVVTFGCIAECQSTTYQTQQLMEYKDFTEYTLYKSDNTTPVSGVKATIFSPFGRKQTRTGSNGSFKIDNLPPGGIHIEIQ